jgi:hypothetical protein
MDMLHGTYDCVFSLGKACQVAANMTNNEIRTRSGPFDWFVTRDLKAISDNLENKFSEFFLPRNMARDQKQDPVVPHYFYTDGFTKFRSLHDVPKNGDEGSSLENLHSVFRRRADRFFADVHGSKKVLFLRKMYRNDDMPELDRRLLDVFGDKYKVLGVQHAQTDKIEIRQISERLHIASMDDSGPPAMDWANWAGNANSWRSLLGGVRVFPPESRNRLSEKLQIAEENIRRRAAIVWGYSVGFEFLKSRMDRKFLLYDKDTSKTKGLAKEQVLPDLAALNPADHFVIVACFGYHPEIVRALEGKGFAPNRDYVYCFDGRGVRL